MTADATERAWDLMEKIGTCMFLTHDGEQIHARPMSATVEREERAVYFLTDVKRVKDDEIEIDPSVTLAFSDTGGQKYVSLNGTAEVSNDRDKIKELWTPFAKAWWSGPDDPDIRVLIVTPESAEYWDSPGTIASFATMAVAAVTGAKPKVGDNKKVAL